MRSHSRNPSGGSERNTSLLNKPSTLQPAVIDVTDWPVDDLYETYPEGARSKTAFFPPERVQFPFILPKRRYLYKRSRKRYPDQFWAEIIAYLVGGLLDVPVPPAYAAVNTKDGDCGALIEWFYEDGKAEFVAGGQYMQQLMPEYDRKKGTQHNFRSVRNLSESFEETQVAAGDWRSWWCEALLFDALIGNTDRHQDNWGYLVYRWKDGRIRRQALAPIFDNGTSLGHELFTGAVEAWQDERYMFYINRGTHHIKWKVGDPKSCGHLEILLSLRKQYPAQFEKARLKLQRFDMASLDLQLEALSQLQLTVPLTKERKNLYIKLINLRRARILEATL
jgi:hypothetical protein